MESMEHKPITYVRHNDEVVDEVHNLWQTPVVTARPFTEEFIQQLEADTKYLLKPGSPATFNKTNI